MEMPRIDLDKIQVTVTEKGLEIAKGMVNSRTGCLRASKPKVERHFAGFNEYGSKKYEPDYQQGCTAYVWRMVTFYINPKQQHQCIPCTAEFDLPGSSEESRELAKELDELVDKIVDSIDKRSVSDEG